MTDWNWTKKNETSISYYDDKRRLLFLNDSRKKLWLKEYHVTSNSTRSFIPKLPTLFSKDSLKREIKRQNIENEKKNREKKF